MLPAYTLTFVLGLVLGSYLSNFPLSVTVFLLASLGTLAFLEHRQILAPRQGHALFACLVGGCLYWVLFAWLNPRVPIPEVSRGLPAKFDGVVSEAVRHSPERLTAMVMVTAVDDPAFTVPFYLRLVWREPIHSLYKGTRIRARAHLHAPSGTHNPRGFDYAAYLEAQGVDAVASVSGADGVEILAGGERHRWMPSFIEQWREQVRVAAESLPDPSRGLFLSLTIGEQGFLTTEVRDWFMTAGTVHILSISGSHLGLIALLSFTVIRRGCLLLPPLLLLDLSRWLIPTRLAALLTVLPLLFYTLLAGAETATIRSFIMIAVGLWTVWLGASRYLLHALAAAAGVTLLAHPAALYDISFQLSYLSVWVLALALEGERQEQGLPDAVLSTTAQVLYWLRESVRLTALVSLATMPLVACYFNQVSWLGLFANLIVVPLVGFILLPLSLASVIWVILTHGTTLPGAALIDSMSQGLIAATHGIASLPGG
jgi:competence protein ComEC